jgi:hypothetical protein
MENTRLKSRLSFKATVDDLSGGDPVGDDAGYGQDSYGADVAAGGTPDDAKAHLALSYIKVNSNRPAQGAIESGWNPAPAQARSYDIPIVQ